MKSDSGQAVKFVGATETKSAVLSRTAHSFAISAGLAPAAAAATFAGERDVRTYLCDEASHTIHVLDEYCRPVFSFGGFGSGLGQFDTPTEATVVWTCDPMTPSMGGEVLVVADTGNDRLQLFETDGVAIGAIGGADAAENCPSPRAAWPFFRLDDGPALPAPTRVEWKAPYLEVTCADGAVVRVDLAVALLPDFETWIECASPAELRQAFDRFMTSPEGTDVPDWCLYEIAARLQPASAGSMFAS